MDNDTGRPSGPAAQPVTPRSLGAAIRDRREDLGLTQRQLADRIGPGTQQSYVSELERGNIQTPGRRRMRELADALMLMEGELLARSGYDDIDQYLREAPEVPANLGDDGDRIVALLANLSASDRAALRRYCEFLAHAAAPAALLTGDDAALTERVQALPLDIRAGLRTMVERYVDRWEHKPGADEAAPAPCPAES